MAVPDPTLKRQTPSHRVTFRERLMKKVLRMLAWMPSLAHHARDRRPPILADMLLRCCGWKQEG